MMERTVLITGAAGFIGRHVAREFASQGWSVIGIGRGNWTDWKTYGISEWHCSEVTLDALVNRVGEPDVIVHCAGGASVGLSVAEPYQDFIKTVDTMAQVLEFIRRHSPQTKLIYPSSAAVYGQVTRLPISEDTPLRPFSPYGFHKKMAEALCQLYAQQYDVSIAIVRLFSIYGAGLNKQLLWDACGKFKLGDSYFFGTGDEIRDWLHVSDLSALLVLVTQYASTDCPVVNAGSGIGITVREILELVSKHLISAPNPRFSSKPKAGDPNAYIADITKANGWLWQPKVNWKDGVLEYVDWYSKCQS